MSGYSLHSVQNSLLNGFLTLPGGHRAGIIGNVAWEKEEITAVRRIDSINLRIARQVWGQQTSCAAITVNMGLEGH